MPAKPAEPAPALKEMFDRTRLRHIAAETAAVHPRFDGKAFLAAATRGLDELSLMARLRRVTETLRATLPSDYRTALGILRALAPRLDNKFVTLFLSDYVALYGLEDFHVSMDALAYFTTFGSAEFAVRHFLRNDLARTLRVMAIWSRSPDEHVRRLASEGSRPRLPWSFRIEPLIVDPTPTATILGNLRADPSLYVRKSVANHLNDITKDHPAYVLAMLETWPRDNPHTAWIANRALRTLIKSGDRGALTFVGAGEPAAVRVRDFTVAPGTVELGDRLTIAFRLESTSPQPQRLVVDYAVHYVKKRGGTAAKVFKLKTLTLDPAASATFSRTQQIRNFTTRVHYPGRHVVEVLVNGASLARGVFVLG